MISSVNAPNSTNASFPARAAMHTLLLQNRSAQVENLNSGGPQNDTALGAIISLLAFSVIVQFGLYSCAKCIQCCIIETEALPPDTPVFEA
jgi:hypothetical protein